MSMKIRKHNAGAESTKKHGGNSIAGDRYSTTGKIGKTPRGGKAIGVKFAGKK